MIDLEHLPQTLLRRYSSFLEYADACQIARVAIWQAQQDFDPAKGRWDTFAYSRVHTALWSEARKSLHSPLAASTSLDMELADTNDTTTDLTSYELLAELTTEERHLLGLRRAGKSFADIGKECGCSRETARKRYRTLLAYIRRRANGS